MKQFNLSLKVVLPFLHIFSIHSDNQIPRPWRDSSTGKKHIQKKE